MKNIHETWGQSRSGSLVGKKRERSRHCRYELTIGVTGSNKKDELLFLKSTVKWTNFKTSARKFSQNDRNI